MYNPFYPFTEQLLNAFVEKGKRYFVRQSFSRAFDHFDEGIEGYFLISHYDSLTTAQDHYGAIGHDKYRFLYDWENLEHRERLKVASRGIKEYKIYSAVTKPDWERPLTNRIRSKIRSYLLEQGWSIPAGEMINTSFRIKFGELFITMKYGSREKEEKLEKIEKIL